jgi:hypothetical protein
MSVSILICEKTVLSSSSGASSSLAGSSPSVSQGIRPARPIRTAWYAAVRLPAMLFKK